MTLPGTGADIQWTNTGILLDTGTANNMLNATGVEASHLDRYYVSGNSETLAPRNDLAMPAPLTAVRQFHHSNMLLLFT